MSYPFRYALATHSRCGPIDFFLSPEQFSGRSKEEKFPVCFPLAAAKFGRYKLQRSVGV